MRDENHLPKNRHLKPQNSLLSHCFTSLLVIIIFSGCNQNSQNQFIAVNLVGYEAGALKQAYVVNAESSHFEIVSLQDSEVVFSDRVKAYYDPDSLSGDRVAIIDFSSLNNPGNYVIKTTGNPVLISHPFKINENVYHDVLYTMVKSYYFHRCGMAVGNETEWSYQVCHLNNAPFYNNPNRSKRVTGHQFYSHSCICNKCFFNINKRIE